MTDDLIPWLRAQLDALAERAPFIHHANCEYFHHTWSHEESLEYCTCQEPARVLAEVDAKRRILDRCEYYIKHEDPTLAEEVLRLQADPLAAYPGYREEWRP